MIQITLCNDIAIEIPQKEDCNHYCIVEDDEELLAYAGLYLSDSLEIITTWFLSEDEMIKDGLIKTLVNYAKINDYKYIYTLDSVIKQYLYHKDILLNHHCFSVEQFIKCNQCRG
ncbi:MAG: hypothetical protein ACOWWR_16760 [Eubacteriales bacterium]